MARMVTRITRLGKLRFRGKADLFPYALLAPSIIALALLRLYPIAKAFAVSFTRNILSRPGQPFVGLQNYQYILSRPQTWNALRVAAVYTIAVVLGSVTVGLIVALALREDIKGRALLRVGVIIPWVMPEVVTAFVWTWMFDYQFGILNHALQAIGIIKEPIGWLTTTTWAMPSMCLVGMWKQFPIAFIMLLAGLQSIPKELYEAATMDGANALQSLRHVTLPGLKSVLGVLALLLTLWSFRSFTHFYLMTGGGPSRSTETAVVLVYLQAFKYYDFGVGSALGIIVLLILCVFSLVYMKAVYGSQGRSN